MAQHDALSSRGPEDTKAQVTQQDESIQPSARRGPRLRVEVESERKLIRGETEREVDAVVAEFHLQLPRNQAKSVGAVYARYSSRHQDSIADQVRGCLQGALRLNIFIPREHIFFDLAVRGAKQIRPDLDRLKKLLAGKIVRALLIFATNRLFRKTYKSLQFVEEEVVGRQIRCVFVRSNIDTADEKQWRLLLNHYAGIDEFVNTMNVENVRAAQEGLFRQGLVGGTITFGYRGKPLTEQSTRQRKPRRRYEIDPETAMWVRKVFSWYVEEKLTIAELIRRLNDDPNIPLPPKAVSGRWTRTAVILLLRNTRYRGAWEYGKMKAEWQVVQDYSRQFKRDQPLAQMQFEELRIIDDATWYAAERRLAAEAGQGSGRRPNDGIRKSRPLLLNGFFFCATHNHKLYVGGPAGLMLVCPVCQGLPAAKRSLFTQLNRAMSLRLTCAKLAELIRADPDLVVKVKAAFIAETEAGQQADPARLDMLVRCIEKLTARINFIRSNPGETKEDRDESAVAIRKLQAERTEARAEKAGLEALRNQPKPMPTEEDVVAALQAMGDVLDQAATHSSGGEAAGAARELIELLIGGRIELEQMGERKVQRGWLRGRFRVRLLDILIGKLRGVASASGEPGVEVAIDYVEPTEAELWADRVHELADQGLLLKVIAQKLQINRNLVTKALAAWYTRQGLPSPDGRSRRLQLTQKNTEPRRHQALAEEVKRLMDEGLLLNQIGERLGCSLTIITAAKNHWFESRGLDAPDGRTRRRDLEMKSSAKTS